MRQLKQSELPRDTRGKEEKAKEERGKDEGGEEERVCTPSIMVIVQKSGVYPRERACEHDIVGHLLTSSA